MFEWLNLTIFMLKSIFVDKTWQVSLRIYFFLCIIHILDVKWTSQDSQAEEVVLCM